MSYMMAYLVLSKAIIIQAHYDNRKLFLRSVCPCFFCKSRTVQYLEIFMQTNKPIAALIYKGNERSLSIFLNKFSLWIMVKYFLIFYSLPYWLNFRLKCSFVDYSYLILQSAIKWCDDVSSWVFLYLCHKVMLS